MTLSDPVRWLYDLQHFGVKLGLDNIRRLLELSGHPESAFSSVIVGGTNGKGSVAAMLEAMLEATGIRAGMFTSPHLVRPNERIRVAGSDIDDASLDRILLQLRGRIEAGLRDGRLETSPSFFEVIAAAALVTFRERAVRAAVLEVGLGGRLDATNAVPADVAVVVSVDLDHTKTLGGTVEKIAAEKAGIVKLGKPLISGAVRQRAIDVLRRRAAQQRATWVDARVAVRLDSAEDASSISLSTANERYPDLELSLPGRHQIDNARVALAAYECLAAQMGVSPDPDAVRRGLRRVRWAGRLQWTTHSSGRRLLFDGAHNPAGARVLARYLRSTRLPRPLLLFGAVHGKLLDDMIRPLAPLISGVIVTRPDVRRAADPEEVAEVLRRHVAEVRLLTEPGEALAAAVESTGPDEYVLISGSLYLIGQLMALMEPTAAAGPVSM